jgi:hypothetical protein
MTGSTLKLSFNKTFEPIRPTNNKQFMVADFHTYLVQEVIDQKLEELRRSERFAIRTSSTSSTPTTIAWIEKLLQAAIPDYRKHARDLIIIPYLIVCKGLTDRNQIYDIVTKWADKCGEIKRLEPSRREFSVRVRSRIDEVMRDRIPPMRYETLKEENPELYETLKLTGDS